MRKAEIDEILMPGDPKREQSREQEVRTRFWDKLKSTAARIPFVDEVVAAYYCALDPETPTRVRGTLFAALAYFILPVDSIPDFLVGFGLTDDITVLSAAISMVGAHITRAHRKAAQDFLGSETLDKKSA